LRALLWLRGFIRTLSTFAAAGNSGAAQNNLATSRTYDCTTAAESR